MAVRDGKIVGMTAHCVSDGVAWLDQLYVCPRYKRRGVGTALLESVKSQTGLKLQLYTFQMNHEAAAFYERHGFVAVAYRVARPTFSADAGLLVAMAAAALFVKQGLRIRRRVPSVAKYPRARNGLPADSGRCCYTIVVSIPPIHPTT